MWQEENLMLLRYFYDEQLAQASYLVGCVKTGEALVVDPMRAIQPYVETAAKAGLRITGVTETHIHADFVSGGRELAAATGATLYLSDMGDAEWKYAFAGEPNVVLVRDGDRWRVGNVQIEAMHTPGHTPEHMALILTDAGADQPMGVFTGDFLFVGDVGRPDLLEEAAGYKGTKEPGARTQFQTVQRFKTLPDFVQIWPGHGAGSACGKALGAIPSTTLGYEKLFNPALQFEEEAGFVRWLLAGQPEPPRYFAQMKKVNKLGPTLLRKLPTPKLLDRGALERVLQAGHLVVDLRSAADYAQRYLPGTINIPATEPMFSTFIGWFINYDQPLYLIAPDLSQMPAIVTALRAIGVDNLPGYFAPEAVAQGERLPRITAADLAQRLAHNGLTLLDVRGQSEYAELHTAGARHIPLGYLPQRLAEVPRDQPVVTQCATGYRSQIAASLLRRAGYQNVINLSDGIEAWSRLLPLAN
jgi:hydroxyacylglutathione hydrolase